MKHLHWIPVVLALAGCDLEETRNRHVAVHALDSMFNDGDVSVIDEHFEDPYIQHNPTIPNGVAALRAFVESLKGSGVSLTSFRAAAQDDLVAVHSQFAFGPQDPGLAVVDIFRFDGERIVEHWDVIAPVQTETANGHTMFDGPGDPFGSNPAPGQEADNISVVTELYDQGFNAGDLSVLESLVAEDYIQHNPQIPDGRAGLLGALAFWHETFPELRIKPVRFIAEDDLVFAHFHLTFAEEDRDDLFAGSAGVDIFRLEDGVIAEHWDAIQEVPPKSVSGNPMF